MTNGKIALLIVSCDAYSDLWSVFFDLLEKNWPDCPYNTYLLSNHKTYESNKIKSLRIGEDESWSDGLEKGIKKLTEYDYVFLIMEDMLITEPVDTALVVRTINKFLSLDGNFLTLLNEPKPDKKTHDLFGTISPGAMYRSTATAALWKREVLLDLIDKKESAWAFEKIGAKRSDKYDKFFSVYQHQFRFLHGVIKGTWLPETVEKLKEMGFDLKLERPVFEGKADWKRKGYDFVRKVIIQLTPFKYRRKLLRLK